MCTPSRMHWQRKASAESPPLTQRRAESDFSAVVGLVIELC
jgi:hypothetical protein